MIAYLNGVFLEEEEAKISPFDRGFLLGDGLFETMRAYSGITFALYRHLDRLADGARYLRIEGFPARDEMAAVVRVLLAKNDIGDARIRVTVTRGSGQPDNPTVFVTVKPFSGYPELLYQEGLATIILPGYRTSSLPILTSIKTTSQIKSVMAKAAAREAGADEPILLNEKEEVAEGAITNAFVVLGGKLVTPPIEAGALPGITSAIVIELAGLEGIPCEVATVHRDDLLEVEELFVTNSLMEVMPVTRLDGRKVGDGGPGRVTRRLGEAYKKLVASKE